jgi:hypothetical protein
MVGLIAAWAPQRQIFVLCDSAYAGRMMLENRPDNVHIISRLRMDAALYAPPPARKRGQRGRARRRGARLPTPQRTAQHTKKWRRLHLNIYSRRVNTLITERTALWYVALRDTPVKIVIVRDPKRHRKDEAFFCTDTHVDATFILEGFARRWCLEVTFHDVKQFLGFEDPQNQTEKASPAHGTDGVPALTTSSSSGMQQTSPAAAPADGWRSHGTAESRSRPSVTCWPPHVALVGGSTFLIHRR